MSRLEFEHVGDVNSKYPYLCVYLQGAKEPFMEVGIDELKQLALRLYAQQAETVLTCEEWQVVLDKARAFLPKALADEEAYLASRPDQDSTAK
jgi:hypothetical protein